MSFEEIKKEIMKCKIYHELDNQSHHGITRMEHTMRVSRNVYKISKKLHFDYISATRAALLHDFFFNDDFGTIKGIKKGIYHPGIAAKKASKYFKLNEIEINSIETHMFPLNPKIPKYKEGWVLTIVDKTVAIYEYASRKFNPNKITAPMRVALNFLMILVFNIITIGHK